MLLYCVAFSLFALGLEVELLSRIRPWVCKGLMGLQGFDGAEWLPVSQLGLAWSDAWIIENLVQHQCTLTSRWWSEVKSCNCFSNASDSLQAVFAIEEAAIRSQARSIEQVQSTAQCYINLKEHWRTTLWLSFSDYIAKSRIFTNVKHCLNTCLFSASTTIWLFSASLFWQVKRS